MKQISNLYSKNSVTILVCSTDTAIKSVNFSNFSKYKLIYLITLVNDNRSRSFTHLSLSNIVNLLFTLICGDASFLKPVKFDTISNEKNWTWSVILVISQHSTLLILNLKYIDKKRVVTLIKQSLIRVRSVLCLSCTYKPLKVFITVM